jgi:hypothetical protein
LDRAGVNVDVVQSQHRRVVQAEQKTNRAIVERLPVVGGALLLGWAC